jgi:hypothetical protein
MNGTVTLALYALRIAGVGALALGLALWTGRLLGLAVIGLGMTQGSLLPGAEHWVIRAVHLLLGLGALSQGERLARLLRTRSEEETKAVPAMPS